MLLMDIIHSSLKSRPSAGDLGDLIIFCALPVLGEPTNPKLAEIWQETANINKPYAFLYTDLQITLLFFVTPCLFNVFCPTLIFEIATPLNLHH